MEDNRIVDLYWTRNETAITETTSKYGKYCYAIAYNILYDKEDADESVNDTYLGAWNAMPPHRPSILQTFLGKITRRVSLKKWRDSHRDKRGGGEVFLALDELSECVPSNVGSMSIKKTSKKSKERFFGLVWSEPLVMGMRAEGIVIAVNVVKNG